MGILWMLTGALLTNLIYANPNLKQRMLSLLRQTKANDAIGAEILDQAIAFLEGLTN